MKHSGKIFPKFGYTSRGCPLFFENAVPFATGNCRKFRPEVLVEWKAFIIFFSALTGTTENFCSICLNNLQCRQPLERTRKNITYSNSCLQFEKQWLFIVWNIPYGKTVLPFKISLPKNFPKRVYHLVSNGTFRKFFVNGKKTISVSFDEKFSPPEISVQMVSAATGFPVGMFQTQIRVLFVQTYLPRLM